jgi:predicted RNA binding protein YcfA (HicA-like mRNA interferase family)
VKLARDPSGTDLAGLLRRYSHEVTRQTGSHLRLTSTARGAQHHISIPRHTELRVGTLNAILTEVAQHFEVEKDQLLAELFGP